MRRVLVERHPVPVGRLGGVGFAGGVRSLGGVREAGPDPRALARLKAAQLRQALITVAVVGGVLVGLPVTLTFLTSEAGWLVLTLAAQPLWVAIALWQLRRAESLETGPSETGRTERCSPPR